MPHTSPMSGDAAVPGDGLLTGGGPDQHLEK